MKKKLSSPVLVQDDDNPDSLIEVQVDLETLELKTTGRTFFGYTKGGMYEAGYVPIGEVHIPGQEDQPLFWIKSSDRTFKERDDTT